MEVVAEYLKAQAVGFLKNATLTSVRWPSSRVHALRVSTRRLRMALWWLEAGTKDSALRKARRSLGKYGRVLGERRQWDVIVQDAHKYGLDPKAIESERKTSLAAIKAFQQSKKGRRVFERTRHAIERLASIEEFDTSRPLTKLRKPLEYWIARLPKTDLEFHECRIALKKTRYVMEALGLDVKDLKKLQDWLGKAHDLQLLQQTLGTNQKIEAAQEKAKLSASRALPGTLRATLGSLRLERIGVE